MSVQKDILSTLAYFDIFNYPLKKREVFLFLPNNYNVEVFDHALSELLMESIIFKVGEFYSLRDNYYLCDRRNVGNKKASGLLATAERIASFLARFPYVRAVGVSGSLSKEFADDESDIDFFIITKKNRLWIARTIMHCFKKLAFLVNKQHFFCMNYYIDEAMLEINEKNIYTATEVVTLFPFEGYNTFNKFYSANAWTKNFLPNNYLRIASAKDSGSSMLKKIIEATFNNIGGDLLDKVLMQITAKRWATKTKKEKLTSRGIVMSMHASRHFAKPNPCYFQDKLVASFFKRSNEVISSYENSLTSHLSNT